MLETCKDKMNFCQCVDWSPEEGPGFVDHLLGNYEFDHFELDYTSLDKGSELRLCQIGKCRQCGGQICIGAKIPACELLSDTLGRIYDAAVKRWRWYHEDEDFTPVFLNLFRGRDQQVAKLWLDLTRAKTVVKQLEPEEESC